MESAPSHLVQPEALRLFQALADENRLRIVTALLDGERCVCELMERLDLGQSLLSHHLRTLKEAGLVSDRRDGRWVHYSLVPGAFDELRTLLARVRDEARAVPFPAARCS